MAHWIRIFSVVALGMTMPLEASAQEGRQIVREMLSKNAAWLALNRCSIR